MSSQSNSNEPSSISTLSNWLVPNPTSLVYLVLIVFLIYRYKKQNEKKGERLAAKLEHSKLKLMPTPKPMPIIGHIYLMRDYPDNPWEGFNAIRRDYGDVVRLKMGIHPMILVSSVDVMREVLIKKGDIFADRPTFPRHDIVFGGDKEHSLALCNWSNIHKARRKLCKRGMVPNKLSDRSQLLEDIVNKMVARFIDTIQAKRQKTTSPNQERCPFLIAKDDVLFLTGDVFMKFLCQQSCDHQDTAYSKFNEGCDFIFYDINQCYLLDFLPYLTSCGLGFMYLKQLKTITDYCRFFIDDNIFEPRRRKLNQLFDNYTKKDLRENLEEVFASKEYDYLDTIIIEEMSGLTAMSIEDYKVGFADLLAGHAAVSNIMMKLLGHLSLDQEAQDLICAEAKSLKGPASFHQLPVAGAALQEALRLASSPIVPHVARENTSLDGFYVPKGSAVLFNCYNVNLSEELWTNPKQFNLKRFLEVSENSEGEKSYKLNIPKHFMPFSVGKRQCLGYRMVEAITTVAVSKICEKFNFKANDEDLVQKLLEPRGTIALNPQQTCFKLNLTLRQFS